LPIGKTLEDLTLLVKEIRCVALPGSNACAKCQSGGTQCVFVENPESMRKRCVNS
jgi:hypothetical protein